MTARTKATDSCDLGPGAVPQENPSPDSLDHCRRRSVNCTDPVVSPARCSTDEQDLTAQRDALHELGVTDDRLYLDHGLTGTTRARPGLDQALAAVRAGDTLVVPKLDRLARSVPDARAIGDALAARHIALSLGGRVYDPTTGDYTITDPAELFSVSRPTIYRVLERTRAGAGG